MTMRNHHLEGRFQSSAGEIVYGAEGTGPDVVLVHGTPTSSLIWRGVIERLSSQYRLHYLDLPGYGASAKFEGQEVRLRSFARVLREWLDHLKLQRPHLVGHDFGGATVLGAHLVEQVPAASIVVADGVVLNPWGTPYSLHVRNYESVFSKVPGYIHRATLAAHLATAVSRPLPVGFEDWLLKPWTGEIGQLAYYRQVAQYDHDYTARLEALYHTIAVPTLVLWGEEDRWVHIETAHRLRKLIPAAQLETLPDAGHFSMLDCPGLFARLLYDWLASRE